MPREIWNEGRVQGYSAFELYVKQHLAEDPDSEPASEREWLANSLAMGSSMLLQIPNVSQLTEDTYKYIDIQFPSNTRLAAANTVIAEFFEGKGALNNSQYWANRVEDYGDLISNTSSSAPSQGEQGTNAFIPAKNAVSTIWDDVQRAKLKDYMKIVDAIIIQPGYWYSNTSSPPYEDFSPNFKLPPRIRLLIKGNITTNPWILLTGFTIRYVLCGTLGQDTSCETISPQDGDFLGPAVYPWCNRVIFHVPNQYIDFFSSGSYDRTINYNGNDGWSTRRHVVHDSSIIDMRQRMATDSAEDGRLEHYFKESVSTDIYYYKKAKPNINYLDEKKSSRITYNVNDFVSLGPGDSVLTVYQKKDIYPPALYGTYVAAKGTNYLQPIDVVAPGTVKMFMDGSASDLKNYEDEFPGTFGLSKDYEDGTISSLNVENKLTYVAKVDNTPQLLVDTGTCKNVRRPIYNPLTGEAITARRVKAGNDIIYAFPLSTPILVDITGGDGKTYQKVDGEIQRISSNKSDVLESISPFSGEYYLTWYDLVRALLGNKKIDILGPSLRKWAKDLSSGSSAVGKSGLDLFLGKLNCTGYASKQISKYEDRFCGGIFAINVDPTETCLDSLIGQNGISKTNPSGQQYGPEGNPWSLYYPVIDQTNNSGIFGRIKLDINGYNTSWNNGSSDKKWHTTTPNYSCTLTCEKYLPSSKAPANLEFDDINAGGRFYDSGWFENYNYAYLHHRDRHTSSSGNVYYTDSNRVAYPFSRYHEKLHIAMSTYSDTNQNGDYVHNHPGESYSAKIYDNQPSNDNARVVEFVAPRGHAIQGMRISDKSNIFTLFRLVQQLASKSMNDDGTYYFTNATSMRTIVFEGSLMHDGFNINNNRGALSVKAFWDVTELCKTINYWGNYPLDDLSDEYVKLEPLTGNNMPEDIGIPGMVFFNTTDDHYQTYGGFHDGIGIASEYSTLRVSGTLRLSNITIEDTPLYSQLGLCHAGKLRFVGEPINYPDSLDEYVTEDCKWQYKREVSVANLKKKYMFSSNISEDLSAEDIALMRSFENYGLQEITVQEITVPDSKHIHINLAQYTTQNNGKIDW